MPRGTAERRPRTPPGGDGPRTTSLSASRSKRPVSTGPPHSQTPMPGRRFGLRTNSARFPATTSTPGAGRFRDEETTYCRSQGYGLSASAARADSWTPRPMTTVSKSLFAVLTTPSGLRTWSGTVSEYSARTAALIAVEAEGVALSVRTGGEAVDTAADEVREQTHAGPIPIRYRQGRDDTRHPDSGGHRSSRRNVTRLARDGIGSGWRGRYRRAGVSGSLLLPRLPVPCVPRALRDDRPGLGRAAAATKTGILPVSHDAAQPRSSFPQAHQGHGCQSPHGGDQPWDEEPCRQILRRHSDGEGRYGHHQLRRCHESSRTSGSEAARAVPPR